MIRAEYMVAPNFKTHFYDFIFYIKILLKILCILSYFIFYYNIQIPSNFEQFDKYFLIKNLFYHVLYFTEI